jgi:hypothetical protein
MQFNVSLDAANDDQINLLKRYKDRRRFRDTQFYSWYDKQKRILTMYGHPFLVDEALETKMRQENFVVKSFMIRCGKDDAWSLEMRGYRYMIKPKSRSKPSKKKKSSSKSHTGTGGLSDLMKRVYHENLFVVDAGEKVFVDGNVSMGVLIGCRFKKRSNWTRVARNKCIRKIAKDHIEVERIQGNWITRINGVQTQIQKTINVSDTKIKCMANNVWKKVFSQRLEFLKENRQCLFFEDHLKTSSNDVSSNDVPTLGDQNSPRILSENEMF